MALVDQSPASGSSGGNHRGGNNGGGDARDAASERHELTRVATWTALVAWMLYALQQSLRLPSGFSVEDWLGWSNPDSLQAVAAAWCAERFSWPAAAAYLLLDQGLFVPLYAALALMLAFRLRRAMETGSTRLGVFARGLLGPGMVALVAVLVVIDTLENLGGARRLLLPQWVFFTALLGGVGTGVTLWLWLWPGAQRWRAQLPVCRAVGLALLAVALLAAWASKEAACQRAALLSSMDASLSFAHTWKMALVGMVALVGVATALVWWFGAEFHPDEQQSKRQRRAIFRDLAAAVIGRSRYVLLVIAIFAALTLALDQCRDVLLGLVHVQGATVAQLIQRALLLVTGALAAGLLAHSCWLWTRLVGMVKRPGLSGVASADILHDVGIFAQGWARVLAMVPLLLTCALVARTIGDLVLASRQTADGASAIVSAALLVAFAALALVLAHALVAARRRRRLDDAALYYNSEPLVHELLWYTSKPLKEGSAKARTHSAWTHWLVVGSRPYLLPVLALAGMALVRTVSALAPQQMAATPTTLLVLLFALTWWLGVLGALSLWEQRDGLPWVLLPLAVAGLLSLFGWTDNHALAWALPGAAPSIDALRAGSAAAVWVLAVAAAVGWWAVVARPDKGFFADRPRRRRWTVGLSALLLGYAGLIGLDRAAAGSAAAPASAKPSAGVPLAQALEPVFNEAASQGAGPLFLVAAEGGGIRSAFWTAQVLARMHAQHPDFHRRTLLLSGVSGGSMGHAAYLACVRLLGGAAVTALKADDLSRCIDERFARMDAITPLLGGLLFEDVFSRVLPLAPGTGWWRCRQPGCAHINRAETFEREWIDAFAEKTMRPLAEGLLERRSGEPMLALNSTWVETGNRTVATNLPLAADVLPAATQLTRCMGSDVRLVSAAHTSARFPITNPLAGVRPQGDVDGVCASGGHLIDGGYFDNSAVPTLLDVQRALAPQLQATHRQVIHLLIRNGQQPQECEHARADGPPRKCIRPPADRRPDPRELDGGSDQGKLTLYADVLGPALGLLNVSGVGSHGRQSPATLRATLGETGKPCSRSSVWLIDQVDDGSLVPLGWYLSPAAREALKAQAATRAPGRCDRD